MRKKIIILIVVLVLLIGVTIFLAHDSSPTPTNTKTPVGVFPEGEATTSPITAGDGGRGDSPTQNQIPTIPTTSRLKPITKVPIAGFVSFDDNKRASSSILRYTESDTGHLHEYIQGRGDTRISNTTIPGIKEALWAHSGQYVALRYLDGKENTIKTFIAHVSDTATTTLDGKYIDDDISSIVVAPRERTAAEKFLAGIRPDDKNSQMQFDSISFDGTRRTRLLTLAVPEWAVDWPASGIMYFTTSPSGKAVGYSYLYDLARGGTAGGDSFSKVLGPLTGLTTLTSPDGNIIVLSHIKGDKLTTELYNTKTNTKISLGIATITDKCTFGLKKILYCAVPFFLPSATYPDDWYKGAVSFSDILWEINTETGVGDIIIYPERELGVSIDAISLAASPDGKSLYFKDKNGGLLWELSLK